MALTQIDFDQLRDNNFHAYNVAKKVFKHETGVHKVDITRVPYYEDRNELREAAKEQAEQAEAAEAKRVEEERVKAEQEASEKAEKDAKRVKDVAEFRARMVEYIKIGLEPTAQNEKIIIDWLSKNTKGYVSQMNADAAVHALSSQLSWKKAAEPAPVEEPVVEYLPNGEERLPLDITPSKEHSIAQLRDLDQRQRAQNKITPQQRLGWFGSRL
jgi:hypothetical protein